MSADGPLERGRDAYQRRAWGDAWQSLQRADEQARLAPADLERLAVAQFMAGRTSDAVLAWERLYREQQQDANVGSAVRGAVWLAIVLFQVGRGAEAGGWLARAGRHADQLSSTASEERYLLVPMALQAMAVGDGARALGLFQQVVKATHREDDADLVVMGLLGKGQALIAMGEAAAGVAMLDEVLILLSSDEVSPVLTGVAFCGAILACQQAFDLPRARAWTAALSRWCESQEDLQPFRGQCLVHRSEVLQVEGDWVAAATEATRACQHLSGSDDDGVAGMAHYQLGELHRLQGAFDRAEDCYRYASRTGHPLQPGLGLLRLAQSRTNDAVASMRRAMGEVTELPLRARLMGPCVQIMLAAGDLETARSVARELEAAAHELASRALEAGAWHARASVALASGDAASGCLSARAAVDAWRDLGAPFDRARAQVLLARGCEALGDHDTATMHLAGARQTFQGLGATPALAELDHLVARDTSVPGGLTRREVEVLALVAAGRTNRQVAENLVISDRTVARHLTNIYRKLGVTSRTAAAARAHDLEIA